MDPRPHFLPLILPVIALYDLAGQLEGEFWAEVDVETGLHVVKEVFVYLETDAGGYLGNIAIGIEAVLNNIVNIFSILCPDLPRLVNNKDVR